MARVKDTGYVNPQEVYNYLVNVKGLSREHALGMLSNIQAESGFKIAVQEYGKPQGTGGVGLFQHTGPRRQALVKYTGGDVNDWTKQVDFALQEGVTKTYLSQKFETPEEASIWFTTKWERPANANQRAQERLKYLNNYSNFSGYESTYQPSSSSSSQGAGQNAQQDAAQMPIPFEVVIAGKPQQVAFSYEDFQKALATTQKEEEKEQESEARQELKQEMTTQEAFLKAMESISLPSASSQGNQQQQFASQGTTGYEPLPIPEVSTALPQLPNIFSTQLPEMQDGGDPGKGKKSKPKKVEPFVTSDPEEYAYRKAAYDDSLRYYKAYEMQDKLMGPGNKKEKGYIKWGTAELKKGRTRTYNKLLKGWYADDYQNEDHQFKKGYNAWSARKNDHQLIKYYKSLGFTDKDIMYHSSPDVVSDKIKAIGSYNDGFAISPVYKKPVQQVIFEPIKPTPTPTFQPVPTAVMVNPELQKFVEEKKPEPPGPPPGTGTDVMPVYDTDELPMYATPDPDAEWVGDTERYVNWDGNKIPYRLPRFRQPGHGGDFIRRGKQRYISFPSIETRYQAEIVPENEEFREGGQTSPQDTKEMLDGIADILRQVVNVNNRKAIAKNMIGDFNREGLDYDLNNFLRSSKVKMLEGGPVKPPTFNLSYNPYVYNPNELTGYRGYGDLSGTSLGVSTPDLLGREKKINALKVPFSASVNRLYDPNVQNTTIDYSDPQNLNQGMTAEQLQTGAQQQLDSASQPYLDKNPLGFNIQTGVSGSGLNSNVKRRTKIDGSVGVGYNPLSGFNAGASGKFSFALGNDFYRPLKNTGDWRAVGNIQPFGMSVNQLSAYNEQQDMVQSNLQQVANTGTYSDLTQNVNNYDNTKPGVASGVQFTFGAGVDGSVKLPIGMLNAGAGLKYNRAAGEAERLSPTAYVGYSVSGAELSRLGNKLPNINLPDSRRSNYETLANQDLETEKGEWVQGPDGQFTWRDFPGFNGAFNASTFEGEDIYVPTVLPNKQNGGAVKTFALF